MALKQLSVIAENKKGTLAKATAALAAAGIDLKSICVADASEFGVFRMISSDVEGARQALTNVGLRVSTRSIAAVAIPNQPGELNRILQILNNADINIEYMYSIISNKADSSYMAIRVDDNEKAESLLVEKGYSILTESDL